MLQARRLAGYARVMQAPEPTAEARPEQADRPVETPGEQEPAEAELVLEELLVSEVSIDGMCGVY